MSFRESKVGDYEFGGFGCSLCGEVVSPGEIDPVALRITARADRPHREGFGVELCWCHAACLEASGFSVNVTSADYWETVPSDG